MKHFLITLFIVSFSIPTFAKTKSAYKNLDPVQELIKKMRKDMPTNMCREGSIFADCFTIQKKACEKFVQTSLQKCLKKIPAPLEVEPQHPGRSYEDQVGHCVSSSYFHAHKSKMKADPPAICSGIQ